MTAVFKQIKKRDGNIVEFDSSKITTAISKAGKATGEFGETQARELTILVLTRVSLQCAGSIPEVEEIQDIVEKVLMESPFHKAAKAYILYRNQHQQIRNIAIKAHIDLVDQYLDKLDWKINENSNMCYSLQGLNNYISSDVTAEYWLNRIYPPEIRDAHVRGDIHIHDLSQLSVYTYFGKEVVVAKYQGKILTLSFEQLYEIADVAEEILNEKDGAYAKYPKDMFVMDKDGWTRVTRLVRKSKNKPMRFLKNRGGRSVIVTQDHPMITEQGETEAVKVRIKEDRLFTADMMSRLSGETLFSAERIDLVHELRSRGFHGRKGDAPYFNGFPISESGSDGRDGVVHTLSFCAPRYIMLTEDFGFFVGLTIAEGYLTYDKKSYFISMTSRRQEELERANRGLLCHGWSGTISQRSNDGMYELRIRNRFLRFLFEKVFQIKSGSRNKTLPVGILSYSQAFLRGIVAGIIVGDGAANGDTGIQIRMTSRTLLEQLAVALPFIGLFPRDRNCEGVGTVREYNGRTITQNFPLYGLGFRKIEGIELPSEKYNTLKPSVKAWQDETVDAWHEVLNNSETDIPDEHIYDITTETNTLVVNGMWNHNCVGWDLKDLLLQGFRGVAGKVESAPPRHLRTALGQLVNFIYTLQGESSGAQAVSNFDTLLAPFIRYDTLNYKEVKQAMQEFVFNSNIPTRVGFQTPFFNVTMDLKVPSMLKDHPVIIGGKYQAETYSDFQPEMDVINEAFAEIMMEGDVTGRVFTFPIPTYNITKDFDWDNPNLEKVWLMTGKFGIPYWSNFVNSDMSPDDARSMCCRLRLDNRELRKRGGGLFGSAPLTGSIGVVTVNLPRIGYISKTENDFFERLKEMIHIAKSSLVIKRKVLETFTEKNLYPYSKFYLREVKGATGLYWRNHFSTVGIIGMNEACMNFMGKDIGTDEGMNFSVRVMDFIRNVIIEIQEETGDMFNLEATPAEGTSYRFAMTDKKQFPDILCANEEEYCKGEDPYYTNSTHLPVNYTDDIFQMLNLQDELQTKYTGGTVVHIYMGEMVSDIEVVKKIIRKITDQFRLPYFTLTPTFSICPSHGYLNGEKEKCPICNAETEIYSRVVGYLRPVKQWNKGKRAEFVKRKTFRVE